MASLPAQHPHLALHLTDRALTPLVSTSLPPSSSTNNNNHHHHQQHSHQAARGATFTTSPPSSPDSPPPSPPPPPPPAALSLAALTSTALTSYQTAKRLTHGAPLRTMVEYPSRGPVVLHSYLCPMSLALGTPGRVRRASQSSLITAVGGGATTTTTAGVRVPGDEEDEEEQQQQQQQQQQVERRRYGKEGGDAAAPTGGGGDGVDNTNSDDPDVPMLIATVVAPTAHDLKDARRAAGRLEHVAKAVQTAWVADGAAGVPST